MHAFERCVRRDSTKATKCHLHPFVQRHPSGFQRPGRGPSRVAMGTLSAQRGGGTGLRPLPQPGIRPRAGWPDTHLGP